mmetsp:Transcript_3094/g.10264  ORF Transcript_3094/g.10264 Transcript_3094/m.10264 type:complete len:213 (+) Transcript_3094:6607-7245(+)
MRRDAAAVGEPRRGEHAADVAGARLPRRLGAARVAAHPAERVAAAPARGRVRAREDSGREPVVGRREVHRVDVLLHPRVVLFDGVQAHSERVRVGSREQGFERQPAGVRAVALRKGADALVGQVLGVFHGPGRRELELQLPGREALRVDEVRAAFGEPEGVLPRESPSDALFGVFGRGGWRRRPRRRGGRRGRRRGGGPRGSLHLICFIWMR